MDDILIDLGEIAITGINGIPFKGTMVVRGLQISVTNLPSGEYWHARIDDSLIPGYYIEGDQYIYGTDLKVPGWLSINDSWGCPHDISGMTMTIFRSTTADFGGLVGYRTFAVENGKEYLFDFATEEISIVGELPPVATDITLSEPIAMSQPDPITVNFINRSLLHDQNHYIRFEVYYRFPVESGAMHRGPTFFYGDTELPPEGTTLPIEMSTDASNTPQEGSWWNVSCDLDIRVKRISWDGWPGTIGSFYLRDAVIIREEVDMFCEVSIDAPDSAQEGEVVDVTATVTNTDTRPGYDWFYKTEIYVDADLIFSKEEIITSGSSKTYNTSFLMPGSNVTVRAVVDRLVSVFPTTEWEYNAGSDSKDVLLIEAPVPCEISIEAPDSAQEGQVVNVAATIKNVSSYHYSYKTSIYAGVTLLLSTDEIITSGSSKTYNTSFTMPAGDITILVWVERWFFDHWVYDNSASKDVSLEVPVPEPEFRGFALSEYNKV